MGSVSQTNPFNYQHHSVIDEGDDGTSTSQGHVLPFLNFVPHRCEEQNVRITDEQQRVGGVRVHSVSNSAVDQRHDSTAHNGHHQQSGGKLRVVAQIVDG